MLPATTLTDFLREETTTGKALLLATAVALLWANLAGDSYAAVWDTRLAIGPDWLHLDLQLRGWAADGLLAIFFFVAGLEVKRELVVGELSDVRAAALPFFAAAGGMLAPALVALAVSGGAAAEGGAWAIPVATDIAFALGVLALAGAALPSGVRALLLSMAVIDDLAAIALVAILFTADLSFAWLAAAAGAAALFRLAFAVRVDRAWLLWLLGIGCWIAVHASGVHATVAGIALGLLTPVRARAGEPEAAAVRFEHRLHPLSAGLVIPVFALAATGIPLAAAGAAAGDAVALGVFAGLVAGKAAGILGGARLAVALRVGALPDRVGWGDVLPVAVLGGIGYTVSLLIAELALGGGERTDEAAAAVLGASALASVIGVGRLRRGARSAE
jgi:NhaA family Na+:H+ antiporter